MQEGQEVDGLATNDQLIERLEVTKPSPRGLEKNCDVEGEPVVLGATGRLLQW